MRDPDRNRWPWLDADAPPVPEGRRPRKGVHYGCGKATCDECYEADPVLSPLAQCMLMYGALQGGEFTKEGFLADIGPKIDARGVEAVRDELRAQIAAIPDDEWKALGEMIRAREKGETDETT